MKRVPDDCPYLVEKGEEPSFIEYCSGYNLPNSICQKCRIFFKNYWKYRYGTEWKAGKSRVEHVLEVLRKRFPNLTIEPTKYAISEEYIPPDEKHKKHEPNIIVSSEGKIICDIEVTGSDISMMPPKLIWILQGKFQAAKKRKHEEEIDTWFYTVYTDSEYVLDLNLVEKFKDNVWEEYPHGVPELMIHISCAEAYPREKLFKWIKKRI